MVDFCSFRFHQIEWAALIFVGFIVQSSRFFPQAMKLFCISVQRLDNTGSIIFLASFTWFWISGWFRATFVQEVTFYLIALFLSSSITFLRRRDFHSGYRFVISNIFYPSHTSLFLTLTFTTTICTVSKIGLFLHCGLGKL